MLFKAGKVVVVGNVPDAYDKVVILKLVVMMITAVGDFDQPGLKINALHVALKELHTFKKLADRIDDVRHVQIAGRDLVKHGRKEEEIVVIDERDLDVRIPSDGPFHLKCGVETAEAAAENDNP